MRCKELNETVYLAWYHNGFRDDPPDLLGVCATKEIADSITAYHKKNRNRESEYHGASWFVEEQLVFNAGNMIQTALK